MGLLEADGLIDVGNPIDYYLPELSATHWRGIRIIDILDMATGLDLAENEQSRTNPMSTVGVFFRIELGDTQVGWVSERPVRSCLPWARKRRLASCSSTSDSYE